MDIKFKAHIKSTGWVVPVTRINFDLETVEVNLSPDDEDIAQYDLDEVNLMQFVGLFDDTGEKIYDDYIVEIQDKVETKTSYISVVEFSSDGALVEYHPCHKSISIGEGLRPLSDYCDFGCGDEYKMSNCSCKIIGNKYENPELTPK